MLSIQKFENRYFQLSLKNLLMFLLFLIAVLISIYIFIVVIFYELLAPFIDKFGLSGLINPITIIIISIILSFITSISAFISFFHLLKSKSTLLKILVTIIIFVTTFFAVSIFINPVIISHIPDRQTIDIKHAQFLISSYPDKLQIENIKKNDFNAVIALLHPAVKPFEGKMLKKELENASAYKLKVISITNLLPWDLSRKAEIEKLLDSLKTTDGKYYVHSFYGNNRVEIFKKLLQDRNTSDVNVKKTSKITLDNVKHMERGEVIKLADEVYFTPMPSDSEFKKIIIPGNIKSIVSLLDDKNPADTLMINNERKICKANSIPFFVKPVSIYPYDASGVFEITLFTRGLPKPVIIHSLNTNSLISEAFIQTFRSEKKSFPPSLFYGKMKNGRATLVLPNVVAGPKPDITEYKNLIVEKGIKGLIYCGPQDKTLSKTDKQFFTRLGLSWEKIPLDSLSFQKKIKLGGMWYIYGADSLEIKERLIK
jgi:hypothetical protein